MFKKMLAVTVCSMALSAHAIDMGEVKQALELKDGSKVYIFKDGKMGMEDKQGRAATMKPNHVMETKDGKKIIMIGNEVMEVQGILAPRQGQ